MKKSRLVSFLSVSSVLFAVSCGEREFTKIQTPSEKSTTEETSAVAPAIIDPAVKAPVLNTVNGKILLPEDVIEGETVEESNTEIIKVFNPNEAGVEELLENVMWLSE